MTLTIIQGDARSILPTLEAGSVQTVCTSPPYFGLRSYSTDPQVWGGDPACEHDWSTRTYYREGGNSVGSSLAFSEAGPANAQRIKETRWREDTTCGLCGAWRGELGGEPTPDLYIEHLVDVFREVKRVLRPDGTLWVVIGDSYAAAAGPQVTGTMQREGSQTGAWGGISRKAPSGLKPKDLIGIPYMLAFALRADGWYWRSAITWCKGNAMPESVTDRPTQATEMVLMFAKESRYYYDQDAIREPLAAFTQQYFDKEWNQGNPKHAKERNDGDRRGEVQRSEWINPAGRNKRNWWVVNSQPTKIAHYATYPEKLIEPMILAGTSAYGACSVCGSPWARVVEHVNGDTEAHARPKRTAGMDSKTSTLSLSGNGSKEWAERGGKTVTTGWAATCPHDAPVRPCVILDPFFGSGTTGVVATRLGRDCIGIELSPAYVIQSEARNDGVQTMMDVTP